MIKKNFVFCVVLIILHIPQAMPFNVDLQSKSIHEKMKSISDVEKISTKVNRAALPAPYDYLLIQPLMTKGLENYYQRTPVIQTIYAIKNQHNNTYYRAIRMLIDNNKTRNNVTLAQSKNESVVVELAFITMNFNELPKQIIADVLNTNIPFGKLLANHHMEIATKDRTYFFINCNKVLASLTHCPLWPH